MIVTSYLVALLGIIIVLATLVDAFEVVLLPRPVRRPLRLNRFFFKQTWWAWSRLAERLLAGPQRENFVGIYGPLSMVLLFSLWAICLILGFGVLQWALQSLMGESHASSVGREIIMSGDAFFTLGYGDMVPTHAVSRLLIILEAGTGFGFIALTVSYLPVLYQHFATRDVQLIELAVRAGTPPSGVGLLHWHFAKGDLRQMDEWLRAWEDWAGELIESHSTYPMLAFYRSQHDGYSWLASIAIVLDACTLIIAGIESGRLLQAAATFSAARRVLDEMCRSLGVRSVIGSRIHGSDSELLGELAQMLRSSMPDWRNDGQTIELISRLRNAYEPQLEGLSAYLLLPLPAWGRTLTADPAPFAKHQIIKQLIGPAPDRD
jgi:hypothetical protein